MVLLRELRYITLALICQTVCFSSCKACNVTLQDPYGEITSPNYPGDIPNEAYCEWYLDAPTGQVVEITFEEVLFNETKDADGKCVDGITVYSGSQSDVIFLFCGEGPAWPRYPIRALSTASRMIVTLDRKLPGSGRFRASFKHVPERREFLAVTAVETPSILLLDRLSSRITQIKLRQSRHPSALSFDAINEYFYFTDIERKLVGRITLNGFNEEVLIDSNIETPTGIAVGFLTGLLYWTDTGRNEVSVARLDGTFRKTLVSSSSGCRSPNDIILSPNHLDVFWTCENKIEKSKADGSNRVPFVEENIGYPSSLAIYPDGETLYWLDTGRGVLENIALDGSNRNSMYNENPDFFASSHSFALDKFSYFWTHPSDHRLYSAERNGSTTTFRYITLNPLSTMKGMYYYRSDRMIPAQHACNTGNGGCKELCFPDGESVKCDEASPLIYGCPRDIVISTGSPFETVDWDEPAAVSRIDGQSSTPATLQTRSHVPMSIFFLGNTTVTYTFVDDFDNTATCFFNVILLPAASTVTVPTTMSTTMSTVTTTTTESTGTKSPPNSLDMLFSEYRYYTITALMILVVILLISSLVCILCCCGCCKCTCGNEGNEPTDTQSFPMNHSAKSAPNYAQDGVYVTPPPYVYQQSDYAVSLY